MFIQNLVTNGQHCFINTSPNSSGEIGVIYGDAHESFVINGVVSMCNLEGVLATSPADSVIVLDEISILRQSCFVCIDGSGLVDVPIEECVEAILCRWAKGVAKELKHRPQAAEIIASNPNLVTDHHLALLLGQLCPLNDLHRKYLKLERLVTKSQQWLKATCPYDAESSFPSSFSLVSGSSSHGGAGRRRADATQSEVALSSTSPPVREARDQVHSGLLKERMMYSLKQGLQELLRKESWNDFPHVPLRGPSSIWLRCSKHIIPQVLSAQILARDVHRSIVKTCEMLSKMSVTARMLPSSAFLGSPWSAHHLPTESHRQRMLRELHSLLSRVEELGARLSRPSKHWRKGRQLSNMKSPWMGYLKRRKDTESTMERAVDSVSTGIEWKCSRCRSVNVGDGLQCSMCRSNASRPLAPNSFVLLNMDDEQLDDRIRAEIHLASIARRRREQDSKGRVLSVSQMDATAAVARALRGLTLTSRPMSGTTLASSLPPHSSMVTTATTHSFDPHSWSQTTDAGKAGDSISLGPLTEQSSLLSSAAPSDSSAWLSKQGKNPNARSFNPRNVSGSSSDPISGITTYEKNLSISSCVPSNSSFSLPVNMSPSDPIDYSWQNQNIDRVTSAQALAMANERIGEDPSFDFSAEGTQRNSGRYEMF